MGERVIAAEMITDDGGSRQRKGGNSARRKGAVSIVKRRD